MAYNIVVAGGSIYTVSPDGTWRELTVPVSASVSDTMPARMAVLGRQVVIVNGAVPSLQIDPLGIVRPMQLTPPMSPPVLSTPRAGGLSGNYRVKYAYGIKDPETLAIIAMSDYSPTSTESGAFTSKVLQADGVSVSPDPACNFRRVFRTTTGPGGTYYEWIDIDGNTLTSIADDLPDAALSVLAAPTEVGVAPGGTPGTWMTVICEWKGRLWGVGNEDIDVLRYSGQGIVWGWPANYGLDIPPIGADEFGITGLGPRRDELGVFRRDHVWKVVFAGVNSDGSPIYEPKRVYKGKGCYSPDSIIVINDIVYFLADDGVYTWGPDGIVCISDGHVRKWFETDIYFNRSRYPYCCAKYNGKYHGYELHLSSPGSNVLDRWVVYDIRSKTWYGPHQTAHFAATTAAGSLVNDVSKLVPAMGSSEGVLYVINQPGFNDNGTAITIDLLTKLHDGQTPIIEKLFGNLAVVNKIQGVAGNLQIEVLLGRLDAQRKKTFAADMRTDFQNLNICGHGRMLQLHLTEDTNDLGTELYGYEIPFHELGMRK